MSFRDLRKKSEIWCSYTKRAPNFVHHNLGKKTACYTHVNTVIFAVCEHKLIAKVSVTNNLRQRNIVRGNQASSRLNTAQTGEIV